MNSDVFCLVFLLAREYTAREYRYIRGKLSEIHRDWFELSNSDVFCLVLPACAGVGCEGMQVYSREINWNASGLEENLDFRCMLDFDTSGWL